MSGVSEALKAVRLKQVPGDIETALKVSDWRHKAAWPVGIAEANSMAAIQARNALAFVAGVEDELVRNAALLALPNILAYARAIVISAAALSRAETCGMDIVGTAPEISYLKTGEGQPAPRTGPVLPPEVIRLGLARRAARIRSWSSLLEMPRAMLAPSAVAITHNSLLRRTAADGAGTIGFVHAETLLARARARSATRLPRIQEHTAALARALVRPAPAAGPYRKRAETLVVNLTAPQLETALHDMMALQSVKLPMTIWSGSGGIYAARAVGLEVMRRGGEAVRYDHGTPKGFIEAGEINAIVEFSVSSQMVLTSPGAAEICRKHCDGRLMGWRDKPSVTAGVGDPVFVKHVQDRPAPKPRGRPRVVYAPTQLLGFRQLLPVQQPDVVHLNWQMHLSEFLRDMPVDYICQPHPEGYFRNQPHPLEKIAETHRGDFDARLGSTDVFVFDYPSTTALWEAACTGARIVFLDIGAGKMAGEISKLFAERATVIPVGFDERNRPILDAARLRDTVMATGKRPDPAPFRRLLAGEQ